MDLPEIVENLVVLDPLAQMAQEALQVTLVVQVILDLQVLLAIKVKEDPQEYLEIREK